MLVTYYWIYQYLSRQWLRLTSTLGLFTATACKVMPLLVCIFLDGVVDTVGGICTDLIEFEVLLVNWVEGDMIGSVFITY